MGSAVLFALAVITIWLFGMDGAIVAVNVAFALFILNNSTPAKIIKLAPKTRSVWAKRGNASADELLELWRYRRSLTFYLGTEGQVDANRVREAVKRKC